MIDSLPRCDKCNSPVTDSIQTEIENHGRVKFGKYVNSSWICSDCMSESNEENKISVTLTRKDDVHHEHIGAADKSDVSPNTPPADEANL